MTPTRGRFATIKTPLELHHLEISPPLDVAHATSRIPLSTHHAIPRSEDGVSGKTHAHFGSNEFLRKESNKC